MGPEGIAIPAIFMIVVLPVLLLVSIPLYLIHTIHKRKLEEIRVRGSIEGQEKLLHAIADVKRELAQLRDTTTQYDMSFDTALQRLESRIEQAERRLPPAHQTTLDRPQENHNT